MSTPPTPTVPLDPTTQPQATAVGDGLTPGTRLGRYLVVEKIGEGGAGAVYAAFDAKLDRKVALKLLQRTAAGPNPTLDPGWPRLVREARMLARLSDPEVVTVYDVGEHEGVGYLAMEFVEGGDLAGWIRRHRAPGADARRSLKDALALFVQAGEGLAAAHRASLIHGDFKPANVLIDARGRAKVSDFGIARLRAGAAMLPDEAALSTQDAAAGAEDTADERDVGVTTDQGDGGLGRTHGSDVGMRLAGTPAYMAPEQFEGEDADERTDVFAYCTALFQAAYGVLPWRGRSLLEVAMLKSRKPPNRPEGVSVPRWLDRLLDRGLAVEPAERYASMDAVLAALRSGMAARRRGLAVGVAVGLLGVGVAAWSMATPSSAALCEPPAFAWDDAVAASVQARFENSGHRAPAEAWSRVEGRMQSVAQGWSQAWNTACAAGDSAAMQQRSMQCLQRHKTQTAALVTAWTTPADGTTSPGVVDRASRAAAALLDPARCIEASALAQDMPQPDDPQVRDAVAAARAQVDEAKALLQAGRFKDALPVAEAAQAAAEATTFGAVEAEALLALGRAFETVGKIEEASTRIEQAYFKSNAAELYPVAAEAAIRLVWIVGARLEQHDEGLLWAQHARAALDKAGGEGRRDHLLSNEAGLHERKGDYDTAARIFDQALQVAPADDGFSLGVVHKRYGDMRRTEGRTDEALAHYDQTVALWSDALGASHPNVAVAQSARASGLGRAGRNEEAAAAYRVAIDALEGALGRNHPNVGVAYVNLGITLKNLERYDEASAATRRALEITIESFGPDHRKTADRREALGRLLVRQGQGEAGLMEHERSRAIYETALEVGHPYRILNGINRGDAVRQLGRLDEARRVYEAAFHEAQTHRPVDDPLRHDAAVHYGRALVESGRLADARTVLRPAVEALVEHGGYSDVVAVGRFAQAQALVGRAGRRVEAIALAQSARPDLAGKPAEQAALDAWLKSLGIEPDGQG
ncbi:MAG: serine/threonine-protein kinase [Myxococcota bacterium]